MRSAVPLAHHPSEWMGDFSLQSVRFRFSVRFTLESSAKMRVQDLHSEFPFHRPTDCLLELFANVKLVVLISLRWTLYDKFSRSRLGTSASSEITDLVLELPVNVKSYRRDCWNSRFDQSRNVILL